MRNRAGIQTGSRILEATRKLLSERGLEGTTVKAICDTAGIRAGSFYNLFDSKEQVVLSVVREAIAAVDPHPDDTGADHVVDLVDAYADFIRTEPDLARVYMMVAVSRGVTEPAIGARVVRHHQGRVERFAAAVLRDRPHLTSAQATEEAEALVAALNGYALHSLLDPGFDFAGHARRLLAIEPHPSVAAGSPDS